MSPGAPSWPVYPALFTFYINFYFHHPFVRLLDKCQMTVFPFPFRLLVDASKLPDFSVSLFQIYFSTSTGSLFLIFFLFESSNTRQFPVYFVLPASFFFLCIFHLHGIDSVQLKMSPLVKKVYWCTSRIFGRKPTPPFQGHFQKLKKVYFFSILFLSLTLNKPDRATMRPGCVSACIDHATYVILCMERQMDEQTGEKTLKTCWLIICFSVGSHCGQKQRRNAVFAQA